MKCTIVFPLFKIFKAFIIAFLVKMRTILKVRGITKWVKKKEAICLTLLDTITSKFFL